MTRASTPHQLFLLQLPTSDTQVTRPSTQPPPTRVIMPAAQEALENKMPTRIEQAQQTNNSPPIASPPIQAESSKIASDQSTKPPTAIYSVIACVIETLACLYFARSLLWILKCFGMGESLAEKVSMVANLAYLLVRLFLLIRPHFNKPSNDKSTKRTISDFNLMAVAFYTTICWISCGVTYLALTSSGPGNSIVEKVVLLGPSVLLAVLFASDCWQ